ncbi:MAG: ATP-binding protein [Saprospiraceae bacterium]|nr:ATP-binding protein [Saprospiraceae bacterium]
MTVKLIANIYNPEQQIRQDLIDGFVVRQATFRRLFDDLCNSPMKHPEQHYLLQGSRGMGKTTILLRLAYELESDPETCKTVDPGFVQ